MFSARRRVLHPILRTLPWLSVAAILGTAAPACPQDSCRVHAVLEDVLGRALGARISIKGSDGEAYRPQPDSACIFHTSMNGHFYADSAFDVTVPAGSTRFRVSKGFEYTFISDDWNLGSDTTLTFVLDRWIDLPDEGWYCGDIHVHLAHPPDEGEETYTLDRGAGLLAVSGEGLNVTHFLDNDLFFTGAPDSLSTPECILYFSEEYRSFIFGHLVLMGLDHLIEPWSTGPTPSWPMNEAILESLRTQTNVAASYAHPISSFSVLDHRLWPGGGMGRELPIDALLGLVEAMDVLAYTNGQDVLNPWYHLLGSRIKIWGSAGTDACLNRPNSPPPGGFRVYVDLEDSALTYDRWVAAYREGKIFFTNGPLFRQFELGGAGIGDSLIVDPGVPTWFDGQVSLASQYPIENVEIMFNGNVVRTLSVPAGTPQMLDTTFSFLVEETGWIAARIRHPNASPQIVTGDTLIAHTNPIFIRYGVDELYAQSDFWNQWLADVQLYLGLYGEWENPSHTAHVYQQLGVARDYYESVTNVAPTRPELAAPPDGDEVCTLTPTFWWMPSTDPDNTVFYTLWYGPDSTFSSKTVVDSLTICHYDPAVPLQDSTLYFWKVCAWDSVGNRVWSGDPECPACPTASCGWRFATIYDPECVVLAVERETGLAIDPGFRIYPNPFNPGTTIVYDLFARVPVSIKIFDVEGRLRKTLFEGPQSAGAHRFMWTGRDDRGWVCGPGVYFCRAQLGSSTFTRKLILLK